MIDMEGWPYEPSESLFLHKRPKHVYFYNFSHCFLQYVLCYHCSPNTQLSCWCSVTEVQNGEIVSLFWFIFSWKKSFSVKANLLHAKMSLTSGIWNSICRKDISIDSFSQLKYLGSRRLQWEYKMGAHLRVSPICWHWLGYSGSGFMQEDF